MEKINIANPIFNGNEKKYLNECIDTGWISANGKFVKEFEDAFAKFCGSKYALSCANGTVALHLILMGMGIGPGDEVIMPVLTYIATANAVKYCGAKPVFVDSDESSFNINVNKIEEALTENTKAIMPVHLYGLPADMDPILDIAASNHLRVIEDAAEAHGAQYKGKSVGSIGNAGSFSFFGNKIITSGEGGMVTTDDLGLYEKMKLLKGQGVDPKKNYWHNIVGYNYRMTNMQAAVGLAQLENVQWHLNERNRVMRLYNKHIARAKLDEYVRTQSSNENSEHVYWMNCIILTDSVRKERDDVMAQMEEYGIEMRPLFYPMNVMPPYYENKEYPIAEKLSKRGFNLPSHALLTEEDIARIIDRLASIII